MSNIDLAQLPRQIARALLQIEAVALRPHEPFVWTSGIKSPIYCDNRLTMSYPAIRRLIAGGFAAMIKEQFPQADVIAGTATAGIPHAAWVSDELDLPMIYVRDKAKGHGKQNQIEGRILPGQRVVVIEDLISTGGSSIRAAEAVRAAGGEVLAVLAIFTYQFADTIAAFKESGVPLGTLSNFNELLHAAVELQKIAAEDVERLQSWSKNPLIFGRVEK